MSDCDHLNIGKACIPDSFAPACAIAIEVPRIAFAPNCDLFSVPSIPINNLSASFCLVTSNPFNLEAIIVFILFMTFLTPFPRYLFLFLSLSSIASYSPVDAPDGTEAVQKYQTLLLCQPQQLDFPLSLEFLGRPDFQ